MTTEAKFENDIARVTWYMRGSTDKNWYKEPLYVIRVEPKNWKLFGYSIETDFSKDARIIFINEVNKVLI